jgi:glucosamine--fructose-6-phosphate aminotransferase (isomerizing)
MCGIIAILRRRSSRPVPAAAALRAELAAAAEALPGQLAEPDAMAAALARAAAHLETADRALSGTPGLLCLLGDGAVEADVARAIGAAQKRLDSLEAALDATATLADGHLEHVNAALLRVKDALWAVREDRLRAARAVRELAGPGAGTAAIEAFGSVQSALSALDRLEVRGRDSAGLQIVVSDHALDLAAPAVRAQLRARSDALFRNGSVRAANGHLCFVYKAAAEIGELGDNGRALRAAIRGDELLRAALAGERAQAIVLGHTRWASVGIISQPNAHPLDQEETAGEGMPFVTAVLNGDVDNHADLKAEHDLQIAREITTDAKVIPVLVARRMARGLRPRDAFQQTVASFTGSVAIAASTAAAPDRLMLALRGSGQALYVGLREDTYIVASEPYGVVEETKTFLRMDGETPGNPENAAASRGQIVLLDGSQAGTLAGIQRFAYDGTALPVTEDHLARTEITTRDIDRGAFPHFLLKEISAAPTSWRKTLRGRIREVDGVLRADLGEETLPEAIRARLRGGAIRRIRVIGQGTAAVAGQGMAAVLTRALVDTGIDIAALPATELSGFHMQDDMSDMLIVAISQSGTTTDTNRTVDLVRQRGASVVAIVNRRNSDLTDKADGVLYTSDGRDVEMSVASTKAFYAQIAAGSLLAFAIAEATGRHDAAAQSELCAALRTMPDIMQQVLALRPKIAQAVAAHAPCRRYWAIVGNGNNRIAAAEIRIKLSELCYKAIACDATEDKKHIDLSSEPMILVCAAGLSGSTADDVAKEIAIYRAHKAAPIVLATEGARFDAALATIELPAVHPSLGFVLSTMAGHLFGYEAALAIDKLALPLREMRAAIESLVSRRSNGGDWLAALAPDFEQPARRFAADLERGALDGSLEARTAVRIASLLRYVLGTAPLESFEAELGRPGTPSAVVEELTAALTRGIEELTRPIDAIKHQAKTVTVGISRSDEALLTVPLVREVVAIAPKDRVAYHDLRTLAALDPAVERVLGHTRYRIDGDPRGPEATVRVIDAGGIARDLPSRTERTPALKGTKHQVANEKRLLVAVGRSDRRTVLIVPEAQAGKVVGLTLLHVKLHEKISAGAMRGVLSGYRNRYAALRDMVTETEPTFDDRMLERLTVAELLTEPIHGLADCWRKV